MNWLSRDAPPRAVWALSQHGLHPLMARLYAARGVYEAQDTDASLAHLLPPEGLMGVTEAAALLADAMALQFSRPLFMIPLALLFLGETVSGSQIGRAHG